MKIGFSTSVIQRGNSGIAQWVFNITRALEPYASEHQFTLFVLEQDVSLFKEQSSYMTIYPVKEHWRHPIKDIFWHQLLLPKICKKLNLDLLHIPSYRRMVWSNACKKLTTIHDLAPYHVPGKYDMFRMLYAKKIVPSLAKRSQSMSAVSHFTAQDIENFLNIPKNKTTVIYNGIDHERFHPRNRESSKKLITKKLGIQNDFILYVARLEHPAKNHVRLIHAFEKLKEQTNTDLNLVFAGKDWHGSEKIHEAIANSPQKKSIQSLGFIDDADLADLYRSAELFVYPSLFEGFGLPPVEAMACGTPVVCSGEGALAEVVEESAKIINPHEESSLYEGLSKVLNSAESREEYVKKGKERAAYFDWNRAAESWIQTYEKTLKA